MQEFIDPNIDNNNVNTEETPIQMVEAPPPTSKSKVKRAFAVIAIIFGTFILLTASVIGILHIKSVQTYIIGKVADKLEKELHIDIDIAQFHYRPFSHLTIDQVYLSDQQRDTLMYVEHIQMEFQPFDLLHDKINIQQLQLQKPYINLQTRPDSALNCQFLLNYFKRDGGKSSMQLNINMLQLEQARIRYNEILVDQLDLELELPMVSADSLKVQLNSLHLRAQWDRLDARFEANLHGDLDSIVATDMQLVFRDQQMFAGDISVYHPMHKDSLIIDATCEDMFCNNALLQDILSQLRMQPVEVPRMVRELGDIHYAGDINGQLDNLDLHGSFNTALGSMKVNGSFHMDTTLKNFKFSGCISTPHFELGRMLNHKELGHIALNTHVDGEIEDMQLVHCIADANIHTLQYKGYTYHNVLVNGEMIGEEVNGSLSIEDENIQLDIKGLADWSQSDTRLDMTMQLSDFKPATLNLTKQYPDMTLGATTHINLCTFGKKEDILDNLKGHVIIDSLTIDNGENSSTMEQMKLVLETEQHGRKNKHRLHLQSDYLTANLNGNFRYNTLPATVRRLLHQYVPTLVSTTPKKHAQKNDLDFNIYFRNINELSNVLNWNVSIPDMPTIKGSIHESSNYFSLQAYIPKFSTNSLNLENITFALDNANEQLDLSMYVYNRLPKDKPTAAKIGDIKANVNLSALNNEVDLRVELGNTDSVRNEGVIQAKSKLSTYLGKPKFDIEVQPTHIILNDSAWNIGKSEITYTSAQQILDVDSFSLSTDYQSIIIDGRASKSSTDSVDVFLSNINLDYLLSYTEVNKAISIMGPVTGDAKIYSVFSDPMIAAKANIRNGGLNGVYLGDVTAEATLDKANKQILIEGQIVDSTNHVVAIVDGKVIPAKKWWGLNILCDSVDIHFIDYWTNGIVSNPQGRGYGYVKIEGEQQRTWVTGRALAKDAQVTVPDIGVTFYFTDSIFLDSTAILFPDITGYDKYGNQATLSGIVKHNHFMDITYDLHAQSNNILAMDLPEEPQAFFYGKVFGGGDVHIYGDEMDCKIDVNARTNANTDFYLNVYSTTQATTSNFINFVQPDTTSRHLLNLLKPKTDIAKINAPQSRFQLTIHGEATPDAKVTIKIGEDRIYGQGEGNLKLIYESPSEDVQMQGTYTLHSGLYHFTLGNIVRRNFLVKEGGKITWDSDPMAPNVDLTGYYATSGSLRDLFGSESNQVATNRTKVPVNCLIHMTEDLFNPNLAFSIELPQSDESVQSQVNSIINTDEMLMRQVIYLLVFDRFYTPDYLQNTQNVGLNETYSILSSTITGQINSWLSKLTDIFTMGFNFRTDGEGETASQEYEANFQIHPINQLIINGNFGYRYNDLSNRPFFGDLDIEYLLTQNGKLRAKAYTHTVDKYSLRQANTVQGVGLVFKHDFDWKSKKKKDTIKEKHSIKKRKKIKNRQKDL